MRSCRFAAEVALPMNHDTSTDQALRDYYTQQPQAPTPTPGSINNDVRIKHEVIKQEVTTSSGSGSGGNGSSGDSK